MVRTIEAIVDEHGRVRLLEDVTLPEARRALVTSSRTLRNRT